MACFNGRILIEIMDKIVDMRDGRWLLDFEQTSKPNQVHVIEAFERKKHLKADCKTVKMANKLLLRCGPHLRSVVFMGSGPDRHGYEVYFDKLASLGHETSSLEHLPEYVYHMQFEAVWQELSFKSVF